MSEWVSDLKLYEVKQIETLKRFRLAVRLHRKEGLKRKKKKEKISISERWSFTSS